MQRRQGCSTFARFSARKLGIGTFEWLRHWVKERPARAAVVVTHDLALAARFADKLVLLAGGELAASGRPDEVLTRERIASVYGVEARVERLSDNDGGGHGGLAIFALRSRRP